MSKKTSTVINFEFVKKSKNELYVNNLHHKSAILPRFVALFNSTYFTQFSHQATGKKIKIVNRRVITYFIFKYILRNFTQISLNLTI